MPRCTAHLTHPFTACVVLQDLAWAYFKTAAHMNVTHVEFFFDPQVRSGLTWPDLEQPADALLLAFLHLDISTFSWCLAAIVSVN